MSGFQGVFKRAAHGAGPECSDWCRACGAGPLASQGFAVHEDLGTRLLKVIRAAYSFSSVVWESSTLRQGNEG